MVLYIRPNNDSFKANNDDKTVIKINNPAINNLEENFKEIFKVFENFPKFYNVLSREYAQQYLIDLKNHETYNKKTNLDKISYAFNEDNNLVSDDDILHNLLLDNREILVNCLDKEDIIMDVSVNLFNKFKIDNRGKKSEIDKLSLFKDFCKNSIKNTQFYNKSKNEIKNFFLDSLKIENNNDIAIDITFDLELVESKYNKFWYALYKNYNSEQQEGKSFSKTEEDKKINKKIKQSRV